MCGLPLITTKHQPPSTTTENECSCSFLVVVCFLWPLSLPPPSTSSHHLRFWPNQVFLAVMGFFGCPPHQPPYNPRKWVFALVFSGCGLSLVATATMTPITPKTECACSFSVVVGFLWPPPNPPPPKSFVLIFGGSLATHIYHNQSPTLNSKSST